MGGQSTEDVQFDRERAEALARILDSDAPKKVIVAGPGCGKTFTFKELLKRSSGPNLVLTFINNLVSDLAEELGEIAAVSTFHGFCRRLLHAQNIGGVTVGVDYFPLLWQLVVEDIYLVNERHLLPRDLERAFHNLDHSEGLISLALRSGDYYNSVGHTDSVYRVFRGFESGVAAIPGYELIVVDEYQDFSLLEVGLIHALAETNQTVVAGDDDQALYSFKHASAQYLRDVVAEEGWQTFELPFCSRCPAVVVDATHLVTDAATREGLLEDRIDKRFECFLPAKRETSTRYPVIVHARCSVQRNNAPYMSRYIEACVASISEEDVAVSKESRNPTVLVTGPSQFINQIYGYLAPRLPNVRLKQSETSEISMLDGYRRILRDKASRLGWRIVMALDPPGGLEDILRRGLEEDEDLVSLLDAAYRDRHLASIETLDLLKKGAEIEEGDLRELELALGMVVELIKEELGLVAKHELDEDANTDESAPTVLLTSLLGAKGLQAEHVFIVGMSDGHFPRFWPPTGDDVCSLIVALTRAKQSCTIVTCNRFGQQQLAQRGFVGWLGNLVQEEYVNREFFQA